MRNCRLVCSVLTSRHDKFEMFRDRLSVEFGAVKEESSVLPFNYTDYYTDEMGTGLARKFYTFTELIDPSTIADIKLLTIRMEKDLTRELESDVSRVVNLDPGYVANMRLVLATTKDRPHRIYLRDGIYAEATLQHIGGSFKPTQATYPDYASVEYRHFFDGVRDGLRSDLKAAV